MRPHAARLIHKHLVLEGQKRPHSPPWNQPFTGGVLVDDHFELKGQTLNNGHPFYKPYDTAPIKLQAHPDKSEPLSFRNIWVSEVKHWDTETEK